jgi:capsular polysaccharide biosynthesis protein
MELRDYLQIIIRKIWIILPVLIVTLVATAIYTSRQQPVYSTRATFVARLNEAFIDNKSDASALDILSRRTEIATTFSEIAKSRRVKFFAAERLGLSQDNRRDLVVNSRLIAGTNIMEISAEGSDPVLVRDFTNAVGVVTIEYVNSLYEAYQLVSLDEATVPTGPATSNRINYILGAVVGLALGLGFAFLSEALTPTRKPERESSPVEAAEPESGYASSSLQHELSDLKMQIEQTQLMVQNVQLNAEATNTTVRSFVDWIEKYRVQIVEATSSSNGTKE